MIFFRQKKSNSSNHFKKIFDFLKTLYKYVENFFWCCILFIILFIYKKFYIQKPRFYNKFNNNISKEYLRFNYTIEHRIEYNSI